MPAWFKSLWARLGDASTIAWLWSLFLAAGVTSRKISVMPGGWHPPQYWALSGAWFFGTLAISVTTIKGAELIARRLYPPKLDVVHHGGKDATLVLCPSVSGDFYGFGWIGDSDGENWQRPFMLSWGYPTQYKRIRGGDKTPLYIAGFQQLSSAYDEEFVVHGAYSVEDHLRIKWVRTPSGKVLPSDLPWRTLSVELRAKQHPQTWKRKYRFRVAKDGRCEIEPFVMR